MYTKTCKICNNKFTTKHKQAMFCSNKCSSVNRTKETSKRKCKVCGKEFLKGQGNTDQVNFFCSRDCYLVDHSPTKIIRKCSGCGEGIELSSTQRVNLRKGQKNFYCSIECRRKIRVSACKNCNREFIAVQFRADKIIRGLRATCSKECVSELISKDEERKKKIAKAFTGSKHPSWNGGSSKHTSRGRLWNLKREEVFNVKGESCELCGLTREESRKKYGRDLDIDHINAWHDVKNEEEANKVSNLRPLCSSCHQKHGKKSVNGFYKKKESKLERLLSHGSVKYTLESCKKVKAYYDKYRDKKSNVTFLHEKYNIPKSVIRGIANGKHWSIDYI